MYATLSRIHSRHQLLSSVLFSFWGHYGSTWGLLLALSSGIILDGLGRPYGVIGIKPGLATCMANALHSVLALAF